MLQALCKRGLARADVARQKNYLFDHFSVLTPETWGVGNDNLFKKFLETKKLRIAKKRRIGNIKNKTLCVEVLRVL